MSGTDNVGFEASAMCLSWIPPDAVEGLFKLPFGIGVAHYDAPPPNASPDLDALLAADAIRFANELRAHIEVDGGRIIDYQMTGRGRLGSTTVRLRSHGMTFAGVALPELVGEPTVGDDSVTFVQTAGGHTGAPMPRTVPHPPFWRLSAPLAWSTLSLTIHTDGRSEARIADASAFPRHYLYDTDGLLTHKTALIRYKDWLRHADHQRSPWSGSHQPVPVAAILSDAERSLADSILASGAWRQHRLPAGGMLHDHPISNTEVHVLLDGLLLIEIDTEPAIEVGPGAIFDPALRTPQSKARVTTRALTDCRLAVMPREQLDAGALLAVAARQTARLESHSEQAAEPNTDQTADLCAPALVGGRERRDPTGRPPPQNEETQPR